MTIAMKSETSYSDRNASALMPAFTPQPVSFSHGEGAYLWSNDGRRYLDFMAGVAVTALGHCHPQMVAALEEQGRKLWHCSNQYIIPTEERAARRIADMTFGDAVFFCSSGSEAIETGIKLIRRYFNDRGQPERYRILTMKQGFHGRTMAAISAGGQDRLIEGFAPALDGFDRVPFGDIDAVRSALTPKHAAVLLEPVQGEGGIRPVPEGYLEALRELADEKGILIFLDEVQTGFGRTGRSFAYKWSAMSPDLMALGKAIGAGFPIGACVATERVNVFRPGAHGSTMGGNPLAMAVTNAVIDVMEEPSFLANVDEMGARLRAGLQDLATRFPQLISEVRGRGLMIGLQCVIENERILNAARERGMLVMRGSGNVIRLLPPLIIGTEEVDLALEILEAVLAELSDTV